MFGPKPVATVAISMKPTRGPWGGASPFVVMLKSALERRGYRVVYDLKGAVDLIVLIDPRYNDPRKIFGPIEIREYKRLHPKVKVLHRVNECDQRKGTSDMDPLLADANDTADHTVFISEWLRIYHSARWFDPAKPHSMIYNGAPADTFHPIGAELPQDVYRVVTHHWSDNPLKGFDVYQEVDRLLVDKKLPGFEFWLIGRWPAGLEWKATRTMTPLAGAPLARALRSCHLYLTGTRWEPCGMHHVEGAQCGLPLAYHLDGGGVVEAGVKYGLGFRDNVLETLLEARARHVELRARLLANIPSGDRMAMDYAELIQSMLAGA